jgi:hypothetical protein
MFPARGERVERRCELARKRAESESAGFVEEEHGAGESSSVRGLAQRPQSPVASVASPFPQRMGGLDCALAAT